MKVYWKERRAGQRLILLLDDESETEVGAVRETKRGFDALAMTNTYDPGRAQKGFPSIEEAKAFVEAFHPWDIFGGDWDLEVEPEVRSDPGCFSATVGIARSKLRINQGVRLSAPAAARFPEVAEGVPMRDRLLFYLKHALRSLQRERRRSLFAIFAIAVGVAAIVSLQSLGLSIRDSVTEDIQATHQADVVVSTNSDEGFSPEQKSALDGLASRGRFDDWTWFFLANPDRPSFVAASDELEAQPLQWLQPYLVEPGNYPLYGEIRSIEPDDVPLGRLLTARGDVVLSKDISRRMGVGVGDGVVFENSGTFIVKGIVSNEASGGVFAPYFIPPMPWFAYLDLNDLRAQEVFGVGEGDASVLFIKTRDDDEAENPGSRDRRDSLPCQRWIAGQSGCRQRLRASIRAECRT